MAPAGAAKTGTEGAWHFCGSAAGGISSSQAMQMHKEAPQPCLPPPAQVLTLASTVSTRQATLRSSKDKTLSSGIPMSAGGVGRGKKRKAKGKPAGDSEDVVDCTDDPYDFPGDVQPPAKDAGVLPEWGASALPMSRRSDSCTLPAVPVLRMGCRALS